MADTIGLHRLAWVYSIQTDLPKPNSAIVRRPPYLKMVYGKRRAALWFMDCTPIHNWQLSVWGLKIENQYKDYKKKPKQQQLLC